MTRKAASKAAPTTKKISKKTVTKKLIAQEAAETSAVSTDISQKEQEAQKTAPVAEAMKELKTEPAAVQETKEPKAEEKKEDATMGNEKGIGKEYDPSEFSQKATEASSGGGSKVFLYVGISVVVLALIVGGLFFMKGFGKGSSSDLRGSAITAYCSDTDGGYNRFTKGVAEGTYYLNYQTGTYMDECASGEENKLTEYYCKNDLIVYATEPCPNGLTCQEGICA